MLTRILKYLRWFESGLLVTLFLVMLLVACAQVVARNFFGTGFLWGDELVRTAVLWTTMLGALAAIGQGGHIRIDVMERLLPDKWSPVLNGAANLFASLICLVVAYFSWDFLVWEFEERNSGIGIIPSWILVSVIPCVAFAMGVRHAIQAFRPRQK